MKAFSLTAVDEEILQSLAAFRFLTVEQLLRLHPSRDAANLRKRLRQLVEARFLVSTHKTRDPENSRGGTLPLFYWLGQLGANVVADLGHLVQPPQVKSILASDARHRAGVVDTHIALSGWVEAAGGSVQWTKSYFEADPTRFTKGMPPVKATTVTLDGRILVPDLISGVYLPDKKIRLFIVEYERGGEEGRLDNFLAKLPVYMEFVEKNVFPDAMEVDAAERILAVFRQKSMVEGAIRHWRAWPSKLWQYVFLKHEAELADFGTWWGLDGRPKALVEAYAHHGQ